MSLDMIKKPNISSWTGKVALVVPPRGQNLV